MKFWKQTTILFEDDGKELKVSSIKLEYMPSQEILNIPVKALNLGAKIQNIFKDHSIKEIRDLVAKKEFDLLRFKGIGKNSLDKVRKSLAAYGLKLDMKLDEQIVLLST